MGTKRNESVKEDEECTLSDIMMPQWIDVDGSHTISQSWIKEKTKIQNIQYVTVEDISNQNRKGASVKDGATIRVTLTLNTAILATNDNNNDENTCSTCSRD